MGQIQKEYSILQSLFFEKNYNKSYYLMLKIFDLLISSTLLQITICNITNVDQIIRPDGYDMEIVLSQNATYLVSGNHNQSLLIYKQVQGQYVFFQQFIGTEQITGIFIKLDCSDIVCARKKQIQILSYSGGEYYSVQKIIMPFDIISAKMTEDRNNIAACGNNKQVHIFQLDINIYTHVQTFGQPRKPVLDIQFSEDGQTLVLSGEDKFVRIYQKNGGSYVQVDSFETPDEIFQISLNQQGPVITFAGKSQFIEIYQKISPSYQSIQQIDTTESEIINLEVSQDREYMAASSQKHFYFYKKNSGTNLMEEIFSIPFTGTIYDIAMDSKGTKIMISTDQGLKVYKNCPSYCNYCSYVETCDQCNDGYQLDADSLCIIIGNTTNTTNTTNITNTTNTTAQEQNIEELPIEQFHKPELKQDNKICLDQQKLNSEGLCIQYCNKQCSACSGDPSHCEQCIQFLHLNEQNTCVSQNSQIEVFSQFYGALATLRINKIKSLAFILDDIWLYQYHKANYTGFISQVLQFVRIVQMTKSEIASFEDADIVHDIKQKLNVYNSRGNQKYLSIQRVGDSIPQNIIEYTFQSVPLAIVIFVVIKLLFLGLFNFKISRYLRPISFNGYFVVMLFEGNIEFFTFLAFRQFSYLYQTNFFEKMVSVFSILFFYIFFMYVFAAYFILWSLYKKLFKYFLSNMFRIQGCAMLMSIIYCIRPLLKGITHSILYEHGDLQLLMLSLIDIVILLIIIRQDMKYDIFKSKLASSLLIIYFLCSLALNILLYGNAHYQHIPQIMQIIDDCTQIVIYVRIAALILSNIFNVLQLFTFQKSLLFQFDSQNQIMQIEVLYGNEQLRQEQAIINNADKTLSNQPPQVNSTNKMKQNLSKNIQAYNNASRMHFENNWVESSK